MSKPNLKSHVLLKNPALKCDSIVLLEQIQTIDKTQLTDYIGEAKKKEMIRVENALKYCLDIKLEKERKPNGSKNK